MQTDISAYVTGGTGFMGGRLVRLLLGKGVKVTCLVRDPGRAQDLRAAGVRLVRGDITDRATVAETVRGHDWVFHLAAWVQIGVRPDSEAAMRLINVTGSQYVLEEAWKAGAQRIVHCGTVGALGPSGPVGYVGDETHTHSGRFPCLYVKTKYEAVEVARDLIRRGAPVLIVLPQSAYGPGSIDLATGMIWKIKSGQLTSIPTTPLMFGYVHVDDVAEGLFRVAEKGRVGESYILGGSLMTLEEYCAAAAHHLGVPPPRPRISPLLLHILSWIYEHVPGGRRMLNGKPLTREEVAMATEANFAYRSDKAERELGWNARPLEQGLADTIRWIEENDRLFATRAAKAKG